MAWPNKRKQRKSWHPFNNSNWILHFPSKSYMGFLEFNLSEFGKRPLTPISAALKLRMYMQSQPCHTTFFWLLICHHYSILCSIVLPFHSLQFCLLLCIPLGMVVWDWGFSLAWLAQEEKALFGVPGLVPLLSSLWVWVMACLWSFHFCYFWLW